MWQFDNLCPIGCIMNYNKELFKIKVSVMFIDV